MDTQNRYVIFHNSPEHRGSFVGAEEVYFEAPTALLWENAALPVHLRRQKLDALFCAKNLVPWFTPRKLKTVIMVYDLVYFPINGRYLPEYPSLDVAYMRLFLPGSIRRADRIIAISRNTAKDVAELFAPDPARVSVAELGVDIPPPAAFAPEHVDEVRRCHALTRPYIFYCGTLSPRKNVARALEAFAQLRTEIPHDFVVTAGKSWNDRATLEKARALGLGERFRQLGDVPASDMHALYRMADAFVYVSLYEGFGLPILEAMACGCPVLTSNTSSIPEVAGDAALMVDPLDVGAITDGLRRIVTDRVFADDLRRRGQARAATFTWDETARRVLAVLQGVSEQRP
jgi:glycosyltransferase involved in cell wall biosynthesis